MDYQLQQNIEFAREYGIELTSIKYFATGGSGIALIIYPPENQ